ncbi:putative RNA polymerase II subunit B1 CTD phosphatase rpap2 isoform X2 [Heptranchias perlo]|uniref:putative RNA polymerase II subunit B1 CTD phosphatase rpap2 isoform X2 n=1 Tax=Heptranchias perlo TaxID=212740 RepID=UPI00355A6D90
MVPFPPLLVCSIWELAAAVQRSEVGNLIMAEEPRRSSSWKLSKSRRRRRESAARGSSSAAVPRSASPASLCYWTGASKSEETLKRKAALQAALRKKRECEAKALRIVERLLEINVTEEFLLDYIKFITPVHYQDVVEERSIIKQCGYPVCQNKLENVPKQQYKISTKTNRVYDITERKHFCSNFCYKASKYLEAQIPKDPLWSRGQERSPAFRLLKEQRGSPGEEVKFQSSSVQVSDVDPPFMEDRRVSSSSSENDSSGSEQEFVSTIRLGEKCSLKTTEQKLFKKQQGMATKPEKMVSVPKPTERDHDIENVAQQLKKCHVNNTDTSSPRLSQSAEPEQLTLAPEEKCSLASEQSLSLTTSLTDGEKIVADKNFTTQGLSKKGAASLKMLIAKSKQSSHSSSGRCASVVDLSGVKSNVLELLRQTLSEWNTEETLRFLYGSNLKYKKAQCSWSSQTSCVTEQEELDEDDLDSLEAVEITDENTGNNKNGLMKSVHVGSPEATVKPLPNFEQVKQESEFLHLKVKEFYKGQYVLPEEVEGNYEENLQSTNCGNEEEDPVLPLVDSDAQHQIRKYIVLDKLKKVLPELLGHLQLAMSDISSELNNLVKTFRLAVKTSLLQESLQRLTSELFISTLLKEFHIQSEDLENLRNIFNVMSTIENNEIVKKTGHT